MARNNNSNGGSRKSAASRLLSGFVLALLFALLLAVGGIMVSLKAFNAEGPLTEAKTVVIERGSGSAEIARQLQKEGVIHNEFLFRLTSFVYRRARGTLKAGEYEFAKASSMNQVLALIQSGKGVVHKITIPEGWTTAQVLRRVGENKILTGDITLQLGEGSLLPDTYIFKRGTKRDALLARMQKAQARLLSELWDKRVKDLPIKNQSELITLASIVEKETGVNAERPRVAAVFVNRLKRRMRLQSDPTIIYGITLGKAPLDRPISKKDIAEKTAYNTYQINGLPPGPIANPGRAAIEAVLNPAVTEELYFVADGSGGHAFATNLKDHQENVKKWRQIEKQRKAAAKDKKSKATDAVAPSPLPVPAPKPATASAN